MHEFLFEGIRDIALPCSLSLWLAPFLLALAARTRAPGAAVAAWATSTFVAWGRAIGWSLGPADGIGGVMAGAALLVGLWLVWPKEFGRTLAGGAVVGVVAGWFWQPCVGEKLAEILNRGPDEPLAIIVPTLLYVAGAFMAVWLVLAVRAALKPDTRFEEPLGRVGVAGILVVAATLVTGLYDDLAATLYRWSL